VALRLGITITLKFTTESTWTDDLLLDERQHSYPMMMMMLYGCERVVVVCHGWAVFKEGVPFRNTQRGHEKASVDFLCIQLLW
jgi:hypothetical protein